MCNIKTSLDWFKSKFCCFDIIEEELLQQVFPPPPPPSKLKFEVLKESKDEDVDKCESNSFWREATAGVKSDS